MQSKLIISLNIKMYHMFKKTILHETGNFIKYIFIINKKIMIYNVTASISAQSRNQAAIKQA